MTTLKVLVSAYACEPGKGSEPGVGWETCRALAKSHNVWVITRENNRATIEAALRRDPVRRLHFAYFDLPRWARWWKRGRRGIYLYYYLWQIGAYRLARELHQRERFDIAHHVTLVKYSAPSFFVLLPIPFVWGPVGGGESAPWSFVRKFGIRGKLMECLRGIVRWLAEHDPFVGLTARRSVFAFATTRETATRMSQLGAKRLEVLSQVALPDIEISSLTTTISMNRNDGRIRLLSVGRLLHWKGFCLALSAFAMAGLQDAEYWVVGNGPEKERLRVLAHELGVLDRVTFWGSLNREETYRKYGSCDILLHPSLHESGGFVCLEAMAAGCPVICLDLGGPGLQVNDQCGVRIQAQDPKRAVEHMAAAIRRLAEDHGLRSRLSAGARVRASAFGWSEKARHYNDAYLEALGKTAT